MKTYFLFKNASQSDTAKALARSKLEYHIRYQKKLGLVLIKKILID